MKLSPRQVRWAAGPLALFLRVLGRTWRVRTQGFPAERVAPEFLDAFYHGHMLFFLSIYRFQASVTMVSEHRDGQIIAEIVNRFGGNVTRGSTTRGGVRAYLDMLKNHKDVGWVVTPDGPRGPRATVHEGVIKLASDSGRAIRPHGFATLTAKRLKTWDEFTIPYPFVHILHHVGDPMHVPPKIDRPTRKKLAHDLQRRLAECNRQAETALAQWLRRPEPEVRTPEQSETPPSASTHVG